MIDGFPRVMTLVCALGAGLVAGIFFAFSTFVMKALGRLPPAQGIAAMQSINVAVINPAFMTAFLGTAAACVILIIVSVLGRTRAHAAVVVAGGLLYLVGTVMVTLIFNVPRNDALAAVDPTSGEAAGLWARYVAGWTYWNHVRAAAAFAAAILFTIALRR